jgi:GGDEF domain-containing protein
LYSGRTAAVVQFVLAGLLGLFASWAVAATPPELRLVPDAPRVNLTLHMASQQLPAAAPPAPLDPDQAWEGDDSLPLLAPAARWQSQAGARLVGRIVLQGSAAPGTYLVHIPTAWFDVVQVWQREPGGAWSSAMAGDRVALSRWPFISQNPAFVVIVGAAPVHLMVVMDNEATSRAPVWLVTDSTYRETQLRQSNLSGMNMGLGLMVVVFTVLGAAVQRRRASVLLAGVAAWVFITVISLNGYAAVWLTPQWPAFNDASKQFTGVMMSALMFALTAEALDQRYLTRVERWAKWVVPAVVLVYAVVQATWLPGAWRLPAAAVITLATLAGSMVMCGLSVLRGGRYVRWIMAALGCYALAVTLVYTPFDFVAGLDIRAAAVGVLLFASMLVFYQALFLRERYGRDVLGRAAVTGNRDPLTALLSYQGFQQAYDEALLRQGAGEKQTPVMLFLLPGMEQSAVDHGFVLTERVVVRFAASLQGALGDSWSIARISKTRFACIGMGDARSADVLAVATQVLANCARLTDVIGPVNDFDLRIACTQRHLTPAGLKPLLGALEDACQALVPPKRIALVNESRVRSGSGNSVGNSRGSSSSNSG